MLTLGVPEQPPETAQQEMPHFYPPLYPVRLRVETNMYFYFFAKSKKKAKNHALFAKFRFVKVSFPRKLEL
jgi:hypothetical protein